MASEASLWKWLRGKLPPRGHYCRIESETSSGFPDVNYCIDSVEGNIELKCSRYPNAKYPFRVGGLRDSQVRWMKDRMKSGSSRVFILAQVGKERFLLDGDDCLNLNLMTLEDIRVLDLLNGWDTISMALQTCLIH